MKWSQHVFTGILIAVVAGVILQVLLDRSEGDKDTKTTQPGREELQVRDQKTVSRRFQSKVYLTSDGKKK